MPAGVYDNQSTCPFPLAPFPAHAGTGGLSLQGCALHGFGVCDDRRFVFCVNMCILGCRAEPCSVWAKPTTNLSPSPRERRRGSREKGAHCPASLTHVFKLMPLPSGKGKSPSFDAMPQLFVKSLKGDRLLAVGPAGGVLYGNVKENQPSANFSRLIHRPRAGLGT